MPRTIQHNVIALDLFCGAGGASVGMHRTGLFDTIIGVDIVDQPNYPFDFIQADALTWSFKTLTPDFIWASPPCAAYVTVRQMPRGVEPAPDLIPATRAVLAGHPWTCIENVATAPLRPDIVLEGGNVGIPHMKRRRLFEVSWQFRLRPEPVSVKPIVVQVYGRTWGSTRTADNHRLKRIRKQHGMEPILKVAEVERLWQVDWLKSGKRRALTDMVPPAYATRVVEDAVAAGFGA